MPITEFAILAFKSPPDFSDPILGSLFQKLSAWQSESSGYPLCFFTHPDDPFQVHLITGWDSVGAHEAWIRGERNQELLRAFAPYVDVPNVRMVHVDVDFEAIPRDAAWVVVERYASLGAASTMSNIQSDRSIWSLFGRDLAREGRDSDVFRFHGVAMGLGLGVGESEVGDDSDVIAPVEWWVLKRVGVEP